MSGAGPHGAVAVVGHVEWVTHAGGSLPARGHIADLTDPIEEPAGGGGVAACAAARLGAAVTLFTALGDDHTAERARRELDGRGVQVLAAPRPGPQTPVLSITEPDGERTIMVVGPRMQPTAGDPLPWARLAAMDAAYYAGEDPGSLQLARRARNLVVTARRLDDLLVTGVRADVVVASANDPAEDPSGIPDALAPGAVILTDGPRGGTITEHGGRPRPYAAANPPGPVVDSYGCGDSFAAGLAVGLAHGLSLDDAVALGATIGAACSTWRGGIGPA
ncbi:MAG: PfkB family carbohydrate kinase [Actinomycetota bacterium]